MLCLNKPLDVQENANFQAQRPASSVSVGAQNAKLIMVNVDYGNRVHGAPIAGGAGTWCCGARRSGIRSARTRGEGSLAMSTIARSKAPSPTLLIRTLHSSSRGRSGFTRFEQRDAICLTEPRKRIDIAIEAPHDGRVRGEYIHFTTVDGHVVFAGRDSLRVERAVDLAAVNGREMLLGWCRGPLCVDPDKFWVGFTRIRRTRFQENLFWLNHTIRNRMLKKPAHIALYNISAGTCLQEFNLEQYGMNVVFSILPGPRAAAESRNDLPRAAEVRHS